MVTNRLHDTESGEAEVSTEDGDHHIHENESEDVPLASSLFSFWQYGSSSGDHTRVVQTDEDG